MPTPDITKAAENAVGLIVDDYCDGYDFSYDHNAMVKFVVGLIQAEREKCAKIAEGSSKGFDFEKAWAELRDNDAGYHAGRLDAAADIRKGGE